MNELKLRQKMLEKHVQNKDIANELGISKSAVQRKLNGSSEFSRAELKQLISLLNLSPNEVITIFFKS